GGPLTTGIALNGTKSSVTFGYRTSHYGDMNIHVALADAGFPDVDAAFIGTAFVRFTRSRQHVTNSSSCAANDMLTLEAFSTATGSIVTAPSGGPVVDLMVSGPGNGTLLG